MKIYINQVQFNTHLLRLLEKLNGKMDDFDVVLGIKNGGLNVSKPIANFFNKQHLDIHISYYIGEQKLFEPQIEKIDNLDIFKSNKFLLVDDIVDSGSTLKWFIDKTGFKKGEDFSVASIHWCEENSPDLEPEFFVNKKLKLDWIVYPWEK